MQVPVLIYHKIDLPTKDVKIKGAFTSPRRFEIQMAYLKRKGFSFFTASEMVSYYKNHQKFPEKAISITFDDGWKDNYTKAFPILKKFNIKASIFLVPSCIGKTTDQVTADGEGVREHLSKENILEMSDYGIEFGSHSMNHKLLHQITDDEIEIEVVDSKRYIENLLQKECSIFAYPAGFFTDFAKETIENAGYIGAFSTVYGKNDVINPYTLNRVEILRKDRLPFKFSKKIKSIFS